MADDKDDFDEFERAVREELYPKVENSGVFLSLCPSTPDGKPDVKFCVELGAAIMYNKPILALHMKGAAPIPDLLRKVSVRVVEDFDFDDPAKMQELGDAVESLAESVPKKNGA